MSSPTDLAGPEPLERRSSGLLRGPTPVPASALPPVEAFALARDVAGGVRRVERVTWRETLALAEGVCLLLDAIEACRLADRSPAYGADEARAGDGKTPTDASAPGDRWLTPREIAGAVLETGGPR